MNKEFEDIIRKNGCDIVQIDPGNNYYYNPLTVIDTGINMRDLLDISGNIKPFGEVSKPFNIPLDRYEQAVDMIQYLKRYEEFNLLIEQKT